ncbi:MAG: PEP-CTERM sorting domain-containing protein [Opitutales bacterium]|nr:PEP-CTERM sorting domain-containing protein [Opitutales bacterium]
MLKKSLLIGSAVLLATPLLVATEKRDILVWGDGIPNSQKVDNPSESYASVDYTGANTNVGITYANSSQASQIRYFLFSTTTWTNSSAESALTSGTGLTYSQLSGFNVGLNYTSTGPGRGPEMVMTGFQAGQKYQVTLLLENGQPANNANLTLRTTRTENMSGFECYYGLLSGSDWNAGNGTITFGQKGGEYLVTYTFTAGEGAALALMTGSDAPGGTMANAPQMGIGLIAISTIPEPSAFGLLAGIGAIALTVSRRRRK